MVRSSDYIEKNNIIADGVNSKIVGKKAQVGFDLSAKAIYKIVSAGFISKGKTHVADYKEIEPRVMNYKDIQFEGWYLPKGNYVVETNEGCQMGMTDTAYIVQRSSLNRNGVETFSSIWDPGFTTRDGDKVNTITIRLVVENEAGVYLEKDARVAQMLVFENEDTVLYNGQFQTGTTKSKL